MTGERRLLPEAARRNIIGHFYLHLFRMHATASIRDPSAEGRAKDARPDVRKRRMLGCWEFSVESC